jgi:hypothetical protein
MNEPTPHLDPPPEDHPGGVDGSAVDEYVEDFPQLTPDPPVAAQVDQDVVPDEVQQPDDKQQEGAESGPDSGNGSGESPD